MKDSFFKKLKIKKQIQLALQRKDLTAFKTAFNRISDKPTFFSKLKDQEKLDMIGLFNEDYDEYCITTILDSLSASAKNKLLETTDFLSFGSKVHLVNSLPEQEAQQALRTLKAKDNNFNDILCSIENDNLKIYALDTFSLDIFNTGYTLGSFNNPSGKDYAVKLNAYLDELGINENAKNLAHRILRNYNSGAVVDLSHLGILNSELVDALGENLLYTLYKNYSRDLCQMNMQDIVDNIDAFRKFAQFRTTFTDRLGIPGKESIRTIRNFLYNKSLILDCIDADLSPEEQNLFIAVLQEKDGVFQKTIQSRAQLKDFPKIRKQVIDNLIKTNPTDAMYYILTGMTANEHSLSARFHFEGNMAEAFVKYFPDSADRFTSILTSEQIIVNLQKLPQEQVQKLLLAWNNELANEFSNENSSVAVLRNSFNGAVEEARQLLGKDLSMGLQETPLPKAKPYEADKDIQVINLTGQKFKLLVHGMNAFGYMGFSEFKNEDNGNAYLCTSAISEKCLGRANASIYYGFDQVSPNAYINSGYDDVYSAHAIDSSADDLVFANSPIFNFNMEDVLSATNKEKYNEYDLMRECIDENGHTQTLEPSYIVCFDTINEQSLKEAKAKSLPIVLIDTKSYANQIIPDMFSKTEIDTLTFSEDAQKLYSQKKQIMETIANNFNLTPEQAKALLAQNENTLEDDGPVMQMKY